MLGQVSQIRYPVLTTLARAVAAQAYLESELGQAVATHPNLSEFDVAIYDVMAAETILRMGR